MKNRIAAAALVMVLCLSVVASATAVAQSPGNAAAFHGDVEDEDGNPAPVGEEIIVAVNGIEQSDSSSTTVNQEGVYAEQGNDGQYLEADVSEGDEITFHVGGVTGPTAVDSNGNDLTLDADQPLAQELNLTFPAGTFEEGSLDTQRASVTDGSATVTFPQGYATQSVDISGLPDDVAGVAVTSSGSSPVSSSPSTSVETYVDISPEDSDGEEVEVTDDVTVEPTVTQSVIDNLDSPTLIHFTDGSWTELDTSLDGTTLTATSSGLSPFAIGEESEESEEPPSGNGNGPGPGPGSEPEPGQEDGADDDAPPSVQEVQDTLNLVDADTDVSSDIADDNPDTPGLSVSPEGSESVRNINFNNEDLTGTVNVREYNNPPQEVRDQVSRSVADQVEGLAGDDGGSDNINVVSVSDITVESDDSLADTSATVTIAVDRENVDNPDQLVVVKETFNEEAQTERWAQLDTEIGETTDEEVVLESQVESFSLFAVAEVDQPDGEEQVEDDTADDTEEPTDDGGPGPAVIIGVLVVLAAAGAAVYVFSQQGE